MVAQKHFSKDFEGTRTVWRVHPLHRRPNDPLDAYLFSCVLYHRAHGGLVELAFR